MKNALFLFAGLLWMAGENSGWRAEGADLDSAAGGTPGSGSATNAPSRLDDLVVTATRREQSQLDIPFSTQALAASQLRRESMASSVPDALTQIPGAMIQQTARGQGSPYLRGFTGFRTVALVDGIRLNNSTFREGPNQYWSTVDSLAVDRLEVIRGPGAVMYGSDAIGGTVNALMRAPTYQSMPGGQWGGATYYRFGSAERAQVARGEITGSEWDRWGLQLGFSGKSFGDVQGGDEVGRQLNTGYDQWDADAKAQYFLSPNTRLTLAFQRTEQDDVQRTHRTSQGLNWEGLARGTDRQHLFDQHRQLSYARLAHATDRGDEFIATVSWQVQDERQFVERSNRTTQRTTVDVDTLAWSLQGLSPSRVGLLTYGVEHYHDSVASSQRTYAANGSLTSTAIQGPVADDAAYDLMGAYLQDELPLLERLTLTVGGRLTWARADAGRVRDPISALPTSFQEDWVNAVGSGRLLWHPDRDERLSFYTGASQGFRAPNLSDMTRFDIARSGELETAAFDLEPERFLTLEWGAKTAQPWWEAEAAYYHTFIDDLIVRTPTGAVISGANEVTKRNAGEGWIHGVEASGRLKLGLGMSLFGQGSWQEGEADAFPTSAAASVRSPLSRLNPLSGLVGLRWDSSMKGCFAEVFGQAAAKQDQLSPEDVRDTQRIPPGGTPGWATLNFRVGYAWRERIFLMAALENALNDDYRLHGSGYNQPGRNFKLGTEWRF